MTARREWLFVNWIGYHGRSDDLATQLPARDEYFTGGEGNRLLRYVKQWRATRRCVKDVDASAIFVMQPPVLALWAVLSAAPKNVLVIGDLHTGVFTDRKWAWAAASILRTLRRRRGAVVVTNESLAERCRAGGTTTFVLDDPVPRRVGTAPDRPAANPLSDLVAEEYVLVPLAYASDEPLNEILAAAAEDRSRRWVLTGEAPDSVRRAATANVRFSGFVSNDDFNWLAAHAGVILACTDEEDTMQRAGYEAVCWERPLVTSRTRVLADYFGDAAEFATPTSASILQSVRHAFGRRTELIRSIADLGSRKREEHASALARVREYAERAPKRRGA